MTLPTRGRRPITVDGTPYVWVIRRTPTYAEAAYPNVAMGLAVQARAPGTTSVLLARMGAPRPDSWLSPNHTGITPATVADVIRRALAAGWDPMGSASPFRIGYPVIRDSVGYVAPP